MSVGEGFIPSRGPQFRFAELLSCYLKSRSYFR
jgi:hypothetical protein